MKTIHIIHATDVDQHLGHLKRIADSLKSERRISNYQTLSSSAVNERTFAQLGSEDMVIMLLTDGIETEKTAIEELLLKVKSTELNTKISQVLIDNLTYEPQFMAFPTDLEPIRSRGDMDATWSKIGNSLRSIFPVAPTPVPPPVPKPSNWKKLLPFIIGIILLVGVFWAVKEINRGSVHSDLVQRIASQTNIEPAKVEKGTTTFVSFCQKSLDQGKSVVISGVGTLSTSSRENQRVVKFATNSLSSTTRSHVEERDFIRAIEIETDLSKVQAKAVLSSISEIVAYKISIQEDVGIPGLGDWYLSVRPARQGRNPQTGEVIEIPEKKVWKFKASEQLVNILNN